MLVEKKSIKFLASLILQLHFLQLHFLQLHFLQLNFFNIDGCWLLAVNH